ncbi:MAG: glycosyltransferase family 2 protein [Syntrophales bacterium]|nr:glycosyltransferase family 2 protein [Syntrophales bacterium]
MKTEVSIVIPVKDEAENIEVLAAEINAVMGSQFDIWECIWVDDGSSDETPLILERIAREDPHHRFVQLSRNFGQSAALFVGFKKARGDIIVTLDGDGQNDPSDIPRLVGLLMERNVDMVNGVRLERHDSLVRKISSWIANNFRNWATGDRVTDVGCSLRAFRSYCVTHLPLFKGMHRFFPTLVRMAGYTKIIETPVNHRQRLRGKTKYGIRNRLWVGLVDIFGVKWMQKRFVFPSVKCEFPGSGDNTQRRGL